MKRSALKAGLAVNQNVGVYHFEDFCILNLLHAIANSLFNGLPSGNYSLVVAYTRNSLYLLLWENVIALTALGCTLFFHYSNITEERNRMHKHSFETQAILFKEERKLQLTRISDKIIEGKRKKYQQKLEPFDEVKALQEEIDKIPNMSEENMMIQIFTRPHWDCVDTQKILQPDQGLQRMKCLVFMDLWEKGYYMTSGQKFGGDFLVYPGDPIRFHSHYIAICVDSEKKLSPYYVVSRGRLGTNVKKTVLLCSVTNCGKINYQSLNWCGK
nr:EOG090X0G6M [Moina brachiata]